MLEIGGASLAEATLLGIAGAAVVVRTTASQERGYVDRAVLEFMRGKRVS